MRDGSVSTHVGMVPEVGAMGSKARITFIWSDEPSWGT